VLAAAAGTGRRGGKKGKKSAGGRDMSIWWMDRWFRPTIRKGGEGEKKEKSDGKDPALPAFPTFCALLISRGSEGGRGERERGRGVRHLSARILAQPR